MRLPVRQRNQGLPQNRVGHGLFAALKFSRRALPSATVPTPDCFRLVQECLHAAHLLRELPLARRRVLERDDEPEPVRCGGERSGVLLRTPVEGSTTAA